MENVVVYYLFELNFSLFKKLTNYLFKKYYHVLIYIKVKREKIKLLLLIGDDGDK